MTTLICSRLFSKVFSLQFSEALKHVVKCSTLTNFQCSVLVANTQSKWKQTRNSSTRSIDEELIDDKPYEDYLKDQVDLPITGHKVYVIQPHIKDGKRRHSSKINIDLKLQESCALIQTLPNWKVKEKSIEIVRNADVKYLFGTDKLKDVTDQVMKTRMKSKITAVFISIDYIRTGQLKELQKLWRLPVFDRYMVVLQIFRHHARTREAKLQIALAEIPYIRQKLIMLQDAHYDQQSGAAQYIGGSGETILEVKRRILQERELKLKAQLERVEKHYNMLRTNRQKRQIPIVAVVGYTNCGKTTLIKALTDDDDMEPKNQLFATLDVTAHGGRLSNEMPVIYIDTVGFISEIPTKLINAFAVTLRDAVEADLVIHVRDISHPDTKEQRYTVMSTLKDMLTEEQFNNMIEVCNKVDLLKSENIEASDSEECYISAVTGYGMEELQKKISTKLMESLGHLRKKIKIPADGQHLSWLYREAAVQSVEADSDNKLIVDVIIDQTTYEHFKSLFKKGRKR